MVRQSAKSLVAVVCLSVATFACRTAETGTATLASAGAGSGTASEDTTPLPPYTPKFVKVGVDRHHELARVHNVGSGDGLALADGAPSGGARYFFTVYGFQALGPFNLPRYTHTWAYFVRAQGTDLNSAPLEAFTISWDAADGFIGVLQPVKAGHNYSLQETFDLANGMNVNVGVQRSPIYEMTQQLFDKAYARYSQLTNGESSGAVMYKMLDDTNGRSALVQGQFGGYSNCTHATADILSADGQLIDTGTARGFAASDMVVQWYFSSPYVLQTSDDVEGKLAPRLGI